MLFLDPRGRLRLWSVFLFPNGVRYLSPTTGGCDVRGPWRAHSKGLVSVHQSNATTQLYPMIIVGTSKVCVDVVYQKTTLLTIWIGHFIRGADLSRGSMGVEVLYRSLPPKRGKTYRDFWPTAQEKHWDCLILAACFCFVSCLAAANTEICSHPDFYQHGRKCNVESFSLFWHGNIQKILAQTPAA